MKTLAILLLLVASVFGQEYPDAPSRTWKQALTAKPFVISELAMAGGMAFDIHETERGLHECPWLVERNQWLVGPRPSTVQLLGRDMIGFGIVTTVNLLASKYLSPWISIGPGTAFTGRHVQGGVHWQQMCP